MHMLHTETDTIIAVGISVLTIIMGVGVLVWNGKAKKQIHALEVIRETLEGQQSFGEEVVVEEGKEKVMEEINPSELFVEEKDFEEENSLEKRYNVGISGKIYSKEELMKQIRK